MNFILEIVFLIVIFAICDIHRNEFEKNKPISHLFHIIWALIYFVPCFVIAIIFYESWWLLTYLLLLRFVAYNPILNLLRKKDWFYLSVNSGASASWWDKVEISWSKAYQLIWYLAAVLFFIGQFFINKLIQ